MNLKISSDPCRVGKKCSEIDFHPISPASYKRYHGALIGQFQNLLQITQPGLPILTYQQAMTMAPPQQAKPHGILRESSPMVDTWWRDRFVSETGIHTDIEWEFREGFLKQRFRESSEIACNDDIKRHWR